MRHMLAIWVQAVLRRDLGGRAGQALILSASRCAWVQCLPSPRLFNARPTPGQPRQPFPVSGAGLWSDTAPPAHLRGSFRGQIVYGAAERASSAGANCDKGLKMQIVLELNLGGQPVHRIGGRDLCKLLDISPWSVNRHGLSIMDRKTGAMCETRPGLGRGRHMPAVAVMESTDLGVGMNRGCITSRFARHSRKPFAQPGDVGCGDDREDQACALRRRQVNQADLP